MQTHSVIFSIEKCQNSTLKNDCASPEEIDDYAKDLTIDYWAIEWSVDSTIFDGRPLKRN